MRSAKSIGSLIMAAKDTRLHDAARNGNVEAVDAVLASGAAVLEQQDKHRRTPLHLAAWAGHVRHWPCTPPPFPPFTLPIATPCHAINTGCFRFQLDVVKSLLAHKANVRAAAMDDMLPLHFAAQKGHTEICRHLITSGA